MKRILYLDVEAELLSDDGQIVKASRRFTSNGGVYALEKVDGEEAYRIRWDVTMLPEIKVGDKVNFNINCYYDTGYGTMDPALLEYDTSGSNGTIPKAGERNETFTGAYALQDLVNDSYVRPTNVTAEDSWSTQNVNTPGKIPFYELSGISEPEKNVLSVDAEGWTYNNNATEVSWWQVSDNYNTLQMKFYRETGGMKLAEGADLNYAWKKVGYAGFNITKDVTVDVDSLLPSMANTSERRGLNYLDYYLSCGSYNLVSASGHKIYLKIYEVEADGTKTDVTDTVAAKVLDPDEELKRETQNSSSWFAWELKEDQTAYVIRFSGLKSDTLYALEACAYPDTDDGSGVIQGAWNPVVDSEAEAGDNQYVTNENTHFQLRTREGVTLRDIRVTYINRSYEAKGLEIQFYTDVYEGYKIHCEIYKDVLNGNLSKDTLVYDNDDLLRQYTVENNHKLGLEDTYNYLLKSGERPYSTGDNTFTIPFPPGADNDLTGGHNYTVVLKAMDGDVCVNNPADNAQTVTELEFFSQPVVISGTAAYAITNPTKASVTDGDPIENRLTISLQASDEMHQIVGDQYSLFVKRTLDENGNPVESHNILGMNADGELRWLDSETDADGEPALGIRLGGGGSSNWKQYVKVEDTQYLQDITLTGVPNGTYEVYTMAQIDLTADGPDTTGMVKQDLYSQTVRTITDEVMEGQVFTMSGQENGVSVMTLSLRNWENLNKVGSVMCMVSNAETGAIIRTFADAVITGADGNNPAIKLTFDSRLDPGFYLITLSMTEQDGTPVNLSNSSLTVTVQ